MFPNGPYQFVAGPNTLGIGVDNLALIQPGLAITPDYYGERYTVKSELINRNPNYQQGLQSLPFASLRADGVYLSGAMTLQALTDFDNAVAQGKPTQ